MNPQFQLVLQQAIKAFQDGNFDGAEVILKRVLQVDPKNLPALHILGLIKASQRNYIEATEYLARAARIHPNDASIQYNLAKALADSGNDKDALAHHKKAVVLAPNNPEAWLNYGKSASNFGRYEDALVCYDNALSLKSDYAEAALNKGATLKELKRYEEAIAFAEQALALNPNLAEACLNKGVALKELKRYDEAIAHYDTALGLKPDFAEGWSNKGNTLHELKRYDEAISHFDKALSLKPDFHEAWTNKGVTLNELKRYDEAISHFDKALSFKPDYAEGWFNKAALNLFLKKYQAGWEHYDWRLKIRDRQLKIAIESLALWNGSSCKHLLILSEQGVGDIIFYASMLRIVKNRVGNITLSIDIRLLPILSRSFPEVTFIDQNAPLDTRLYDNQVQLGSLPIIMNMQPNMVGRRVPYLLDNDVLTKALQNSPDQKKLLKCGVAWKSNNQKLGKNKSILLPDLNDIFQVDGYEFINLQYGDTQQEIKNLENNYGAQLTTIDDIDLFSNIDGLLSIIQTCDFIVTTSNVTAHLAGALGKTTFLLVPYSAGRIWYWHEEVISSWYPSISLYSQDHNFQWDSAIKAIASRLKNEILK